jgi:hypothetical protein
MITATATRTVSTLGNAIEASYTIKDSSKIFSILRSNIYSDKMLAVVREYSTNGWDGHKLAGNEDRPLKVTLPTTLAPVFKVRDFGVGLSEESVLNIYTTYGESTKENSNDFNGTFGLGSKSAFAYGNSFDVISFFDGTKTMYTAYLDESNIGKIRKVYSEPTTEHNGVEINVSVKVSDIRQFNDTARKFYQYFTPCPVFVNADESFNLHMEDAHNPTIVSKGDGWCAYQTQNDVQNIIVMGNVAYNINLDAIPNKSIFFDILKRGYYSRSTPAYKIEAPIGAVSITASRESLEYDTRTIAWICNKVDSICEELARNIQLDVDNTKNSAWATANIVNTFNNGYSNQNAVILDKIKFDKNIAGFYQNHAISYVQSHMRKAQTEIGYTEMVSYGTYYNTPRLKPYKFSSLTPRNAYLFVANVADKVKEKDVNSHIRGVNSVFPGKEIVRVNFPTDASLTAFKKHIMFADAEIVNIEDYPVMRYSSRRVSVPSQRGKDMGKAKVFEYLGTLHNTKSDNWEISDKDLMTDGGVYVRISNYDCATYSGGMREVLNLMQRLSVLTGEDSPTVYGIRDSVKEVGSQWIEASAYLLQKTNEYINGNNIADKLAKYYGNGTSSEYFSMRGSILGANTNTASSRYNYTTGKYENSFSFLGIILQSDVETRTKQLIKQIADETKGLLTHSEESFFASANPSMIGITPVNTTDVLIAEMLDINPLLTSLYEQTFPEADSHKVIKMVTQLEKGR